MKALKEEIKIPNFVVPLKNKNSVNRLTDKQAGELFKMLFSYAEGEKIDESNHGNLVLAIFDSIAPAIDENREKYIVKVKRNREIAKNRKKRETTENQSDNSETNQTQSLPLVTTDNQLLPHDTNKTKLNKTKLKKYVSKDTYFDSTVVSSTGSPDGRPVSKPIDFPSETAVRLYAMSEGYDVDEYNFFWERVRTKKVGSDWQKEFDDFVKDFRKRLEK